jgi:hypothetical protein
LTRRSVLLGAVVAVALVLSASTVALAATISCIVDDDRCIGTRNADTIIGSSGADDISGRAGADAIKGNGGSDVMEGGLGADNLSGGLAGDNSVWGGEQKGKSEPFSYPDKSNDIASGGLGRDQVYGGFGQGGVDLVFGNGNGDTIVVAQRGFPAEVGEVKVTKEIVDCGTGEDTVYRDRGLDVIAANCEHRKSGFPDMEVASSRSASTEGGLLGAASAALR